jgi:hypothetical protein
MFYAGFFMLIGFVIQALEVAAHIAIILCAIKYLKKKD